MISFRLFSKGIYLDWGQFIQKTEKKEGLQVGFSYGYQKEASTSLGMGRNHEASRGTTPWKCAEGRQEVALGIVKGPSKGDRAALKTPKAGGLKSTPQINESDLDLFGSAVREFRAN